MNPWNVPNPALMIRVHLIKPRRVKIMHAFTPLQPEWARGKAGSLHRTGELPPAISNAAIIPVRASAYMHCQC